LQAFSLAIDRYSAGH